MRPHADPAAVRAALRAATAGQGAVAVPTADWAAAVSAPSGRAGAVGLRVVLGVALLYCLLSVAGTTLMAARDRAGDLALLRLAGATAGQVLRTVAGEVLLVVALGTTLAAGASALLLGGLWLALLRLVGPVQVVVPWQPVLAVTAACAGVALLTALLPAAADLRPAARPGTGVSRRGWRARRTSARS